MVEMEAGQTGKFASFSLNVDVVASSSKMGKDHCGETNRWVFSNCQI